MDLSLTSIIMRIPALLIAFAFHEWGHAFVADYFGDPTPRRQGRLSLNPLVHIDIFGTLLVLLTGFGWAKPVQTNPLNYRGNPRRADLLVSLAGVCMNFIIGFISIFIVQLFVYLVGMQGNVLFLVQILTEVVWLNVALGVFNLIPVYPLDGFHVLTDLLPEEMAANLYRYEQYGMFILLLILIVPGVSNALLVPINSIVNLMQTVSGAVLHVFGVG